jgi:hypothetical protein
MTGHNYLLLAVALVFLVTNCVGAGFTINRLRARGKDRFGAARGRGHVAAGE